MMLSLFAIGFSEACLDTAPFRRALFELENGSGEEIALAQKIRMGGGCALGFERNRHSLFQIGVHETFGVEVLGEEVDDHLVFMPIVEL
jgi:hypothetical protein